MAKKFNEKEYKEFLSLEIKMYENVEKSCDLHTYEGWEKAQKARDAIRARKLERDAKYMSEYLWSDVHAYEIIRRPSEHTIVVRRLDATRTDNNGMSECQTYSFKSNPKACELTLRRHKNGGWYAPRGCSPFFFKEEPYEYFDFSF